MGRGDVLGQCVVTALWESAGPGVWFEVFPPRLQLLGPRLVSALSLPDNL